MRQARLPDIPIPFATHKEPCRRGSGDGTLCLICERTVLLVTSHVVLVATNCRNITDPKRPKDCTAGRFYIGPDCWDNNPQLHPYEVKT